MQGDLEVIPLNPSVLFAIRRFSSPVPEGDVRREGSRQAAFGNYPHGPRRARVVPGLWWLRLGLGKSGESLLSYK